MNEDYAGTIKEITDNGMPKFLALSSSRKREFIKLTQRHSGPNWQALIVDGLAEKTAYGGYQMINDGHDIQRWLDMVYSHSLWFRRECWRYYRQNNIKWEQGR